jgi:hypothetical protein
LTFKIFNGPGGYSLSLKKILGVVVALTFEIFDGALKKGEATSMFDIFDGALKQKPEDGAASTFKIFHGVLKRKPGEGVASTFEIFDGALKKNPGEIF